MSEKCKARQQLEKLDQLILDFNDNKIGIEEYKMEVQNISVAEKVCKDILTHSVKFGQTKLCKEIYVD